MMMQKASYKPFIQRCAAPPILGINKTTATSRLHHKKAFLMRAGRAIRDKSKPAKNGNKVRVIPMRMCSAFRVQPPVMSPFGLVAAKCNNTAPARKTKHAKALLDNFLRPSA